MYVFINNIATINFQYKAVYEKILFNAWNSEPGTRNSSEASASVSEQNYFLTGIKGIQGIKASKNGKKR